MTKNEIEQAFLEAARLDIEAALKFADDPGLDKLKSLTDSSFGYELFYPITDGFTNKGGLAIGELMDLYSWLQYCWNDDGSTSFVCATISIPIPQMLLDASKHSMAKTREKDIIFVVKGSQHWLKWDEIEKLALRHQSSEPMGVLIKYSACRFSEDTLDFLCTLLPKFHESYLLGCADAGECRKYFQSLRQIEKTFKKYIQADDNGITVEKLRETI